MKKFLLVCTLLAAILSSCQTDGITEVKETSVPAETMVNAIVEVYSTFDILDDFISSSDLLGKKQETLLPDLVDIIVLDSSYTDGDPARVMLDFGPLGEKLPYGILCKDNKYRAGKLYISVSAAYSSSTAEVEVRMEEDDPFYTGDGEHMAEMKGSVQLSKLGPLVYKLQCEELEIEEEDGAELHFSCNNTIVKAYDDGEGIKNDRVLIDGQFDMEAEDGTVFTAAVSESLSKHYINNCYSNIISGRLTMENRSSASSISADFDPYDDAACDRIVSITINGKSVIHQY